MNKLLTLNKGLHVAIIGQTGCGKSFLAKYLLPSTGSLLIVDPKREFEFNGVPTYDTPQALIRADKQRMIYRPKPELLNDHTAYDDVYRLAYERGNTVVYTDEIVALMRGNKEPHFLKVCYQMGRSKGLTMVSSTQRPACIPKVLMSEASIFFVFRLTDKEDIKRLSSCVPGYSRKVPPRRTFHYYDSQRMDTSKMMTLEVSQW